MAHNFRTTTTGRSIHLKPRDEELRRRLDRLRLEVNELRASRQRLVRAADADRRRIERELHEGVQQHLVALAVNLQLARALADSDPASARTLIEEMGADVQRALDETARLAHLIYAPLREEGGLATALRAAAVGAGVPASVDVVASSGYPPEVARTVYSCWAETLENHDGKTRATITVRQGDKTLAFEIVGSTPESETRLEGLRDRVEALGGRLTIRSGPGRSTRVSGSLPISRPA